MTAKDYRNNSDPSERLAKIRNEIGEKTYYDYYCAAVRRKLLKLRPGDLFYLANISNELNRELFALQTKQYMIETSAFDVCNEVFSDDYSAVKGCETWKDAHKDQPKTRQKTWYR
jgi:hypothetical protein